MVLYRVLLCSCGSVFVDIDCNSTFRAEEKYRIMFEGIACWPWLRVTSNGLKSRGINMVTTIYADAFGFVYEDFDDMCRAYCKVPNAINLEYARDKRVKLIRLTPQGEELCRRSWEKMKTRMAGLTAGLSEDELAELDRLLDVVHRNIEAAE